MRRERERDRKKENKEKRKRTKIFLICDGVGIWFCIVLFDFNSWQARLALKTNDFVNARRFLDFALEFTPQYGDSFVEYLRLELLQNGPHADLTRIEQVFSFSIIEMRECSHNLIISMTPKIPNKKRNFPTHFS
jgi:hypothetical protein